MSVSGDPAYPLQIQLQAPFEEGGAKERRSEGAKERRSEGAKERRSEIAQSL